MSKLLYHVWRVGSAGLFDGSGRTLNEALQDFVENLRGPGAKPLMAADEPVEESKLEGMSSTGDILFNRVKHP